ncbi:MAG TPA: carboxypeptidase regulatory-like domain-containing protein [Thermoanaerobaculia bacterium]|nr:carboxypeptidase regulatory-like domain-containing protein [Thermoanaerobaculia bacterium]
MKRAFFILLLLVAPSLHAAIRGTVFATGGTGVESARVALYKREAILDAHERVAAGRAREAVAQTTSDAQGAFTIETKLSGVFDLEVTLDGYVPWRQSILAEDNELAVELKPAPMRSGRVTAAGKPVAGAIVIVDDDRDVQWSTRTDDKGVFRIPDPVRWTETLRVVHPDHAMLVAQINAGRKLELALTPGTSVHGKVLGANRRLVANARLFAGRWPAGRTAEDGTFKIDHLADDAKVILAVAGAEHGSARRSATEITITLEASNAISGVVRDPKARPLAGARVTAWPKSREGSWEDARVAVSDDKGNYRIEACDPKEYQVSADAGDLEFELAPATLRTTRVARLDFTAKLRNYLRGTVVDARKKPIAGARVQFTMAQMPLVYVFTEEMGGGGATTAADGRFRIQVPQQLAEYGATMEIHVQAIHPRYAAARAEVKLSGNIPAVTITLPDGVEVRGVVKDKDGNAVPGAGVLLVQDPFGTVPLPLDSLLSSGKGRGFVESDAEGTFALHLNEAPHDLSVWKEGFAGFRLSGVTPAAGQKPLEVVLEPGVEIRGRIVAKSSGTAIEGMLFAESEDDAYVMGTIAADKSFVVPSLTPGTYTLKYMNQNGRNAVEKVVKAPAADVVLELPATGEIRGRVIDKATNAALPEFSIQTTGAGNELESEAFDGVETFTLPVPAGSLSVTARADGYIAETQQVTVDEKKPATVTFALTRGRTIAGRVTTDAGLPIGDARILIKTDDFDPNLSTDSTPDGEFEITGARREPVTLEVQKEGFVARELEVDGETDRRVNVTLSAGRKAEGRVVTATGEPVANAAVWASSATGGLPQHAESNADGSFVLTGLGEGRYSFRASRGDLGEAELNDVDPAAAPVVLTFPESKGAGTIHGTVKGFAEGNWTYGGVTAGSGQAIIRRDGTYVIEKIVAGDVEVRAHAMNGRDQISAAPVKATVVANQDIEVNLGFRGDIVIRGTVTEGGQAAAGRSVGFSSERTTSRTKTDEHGVYEIKNLDPGLYRVDVQTTGRQMYRTRYQLSGSATYDIAINFAQLTGRAVDETGTPQPGVSVEVKSSDSEYGDTVTTDAAGAFAASVSEGKRYVVTATKKGFATAVQQLENTRSPVVLTLVRSAGLRVRLTDARGGKTLTGYVVATNAAGLIAARATDEPEKDGAYAVPLAPGAYRVSVSANGYASQSVRVTVPSQAELRLALTPGGNLIVRTEKALGDLVKLVMANGEEYVRCQCNGIAEIRLTGTTTTIDHVAPGRYTMQVLDPEGRIKTSYPVTIEEGGTTVAEIHVPSD